MADRVITRRYHSDELGRSILIGLTFEETQEFEELEDSSPADSTGSPFWTFEGPPTTQRERRWLQLYAKHQAGWDLWRRMIVGPASIVTPAVMTDDGSSQSN